MDGADLFKATNSLRQNSTGLADAIPRANSNSFWRDGNVQVFAQSVREEDDEESLKWATLEKLPTYDRIRKGLLAGAEGTGLTQVDVGRFGNDERKILFDRLLKTAEEDNEKLLRKLRDRIDSAGVSLPTIEVRYEHMHIEAEANVGSRALPSFVNFYFNLLDKFLPSKKKRITILDDISGTIKPCRMALLLGPPSSGKTTFMLALAGKLNKSLDCSGNITYNGHSMKEFVPQRTAAYISQHDLHMGEMTVRETLTFSARCQGVGSRYEMLAECLRKEKEANIKPDPDVDIFIKAAATPGQQAEVVTDYVLKVLGLDICADTMVGNDMVRGVSGGQKKRVTTGEMMVGPSRALLTFCKK
ncbi:pleiotropic drug resistance protein 1-like [Heracleum sosnowskyi]|uniref:Pleiotropic drug resistance protein 1-like n=1 Tax=Heracleum sosnowskyi TaxID=360622 RepID=A0AAD8HZQ8_9APIA|nr:pleiotropic drug resistance protein 1-like [Heracleum sosnowskyi]